ncbi:MAG: 2-C-methyl-D-erythritol 4-phosphate cytidylyltransferase [Rhabdochlamydiaceae bacterium]|nr:2-C-methyl-D-erythritol 4-phosphate cytidylyltransferase [Candidatus Amphrikana amoebophyrae]
MEQKKIALILLMAGKGNRFQNEIPKQFVKINQTPIYELTLQACLKSHNFDQVVLVTHPNWQNEISKKHTNCTVIKGGETRQESSYLGLKACQNDIEIVMIHDGCRPFISREIITKHLDALKNYDAVNTCIPSSDTIVISQCGDEIDNIPDRSKYFRGQTPQSFDYSLICASHEEALELGQTDMSDDCYLALQLGAPITIVEGEDRNIKITTPFDLEIANLLVNQHPLNFDHSHVSVQENTYALSGGQGGIGKAIQKQLESLGAKIIHLSREDLATNENAQRTFAKIGPLDGLINCIGKLIVKPLSELSGDEIENMLHDNLLASIYSCKYAQIKKGGHILNIGSSVYSKGRSHFAIYSSSKAALVNFSEALAEENPDLFVNVLSPCRTNTPMRRKSFPNECVDTLLTPTQVAEKARDILLSKVSCRHFVMKKKK